MRSISGWSHERDRHQPGAVGVGSRRFRPASRMRSAGNGAHRQIVVAGPAEAAQVRAAAHHLDQEARAELGVGREHGWCAADRARSVVLTAAFFTTGGRAVPARGSIAASRAVRRRTGRRRTRHVEAARLRQRVSTSRAVRAVAGGVDQSRHQLSPSPAAMTSANSASGSGLTNVTAPPITTSGCRRCAPPHRAAARPAAASSGRWCSPTRTTPRRPGRRNRRPGSAIRGSTSREPRRQLVLQFLLRRQEHPLADRCRRAR